VDQRNRYLVCLGITVLAGTFTLMVRGPEAAVFPFLLAAALTRFQKVWR
jgi:hypothetical protein